MDKSNSSINIPTYSHVVDKVVYKYSSLVLFGGGITLFLAIVYPHIIIFLKLWINYIPIKNKISHNLLIAYPQLLYQFLYILL